VIGIFGYLLLALVDEVHPLGSWNTLSFTAVCLVGVAAMTRFGWITSIAAVFNLVMIHELLWWIAFAFHFGWIPLALVLDPFEFLAWFALAPIVSFALLLRVLTLRSWLSVWWPYVAYLACWLAIGFPISMNPVPGPAPSGSTLIEIGSWMLVSWRLGLRILKLPTDRHRFPWRPFSRSGPPGFSAQVQRSALLALSFDSPA
jgi:hypothetical protein